MAENIDDLQRRAAQLSELTDMVRELTKIHVLDELFWFAAIETARLLDAEDCAVLIEDPETGTLKIRTSSTRKVGFEVPADTESIITSVFRTQVPRRTDSATNEPDFNPKIGELLGGLPKTILAVPIVLNEKSIGVIEAINKQSGRFTETDEQLLEAVATHIASAIEVNRLSESIQNRVDELAIVAEIGQSISVTLEMSDLFIKIADVLKITIRIDAVAISDWLIEQDILLTLMTTGWAVDPEPDLRPEIYRLDDYPLTRKVLEDRKSRVIRQSDPAADPTERALLEELGYDVCIMLALVARNETIGLMELYKKFDDDPKFDRRIDLYESIASQVATAIQNSRLYETSLKHAADLEKRVAERTMELEALYKQQAALAASEKEHRKLAETLREAGAIVASNLDLGRAISEIFNQLARVIPHDSASVQLLESGDLVIVGGGGWVEKHSMIGYRFPVPGPNPNTLVIQEKKPLILRQDELFGFEEFRKIAHESIQSWLGIPLISQDIVIGMLTLDSSKPDDFTPQQARHAIAFADQVAVAIEQAILFEKTQAALNERDALRAIIAEITDELELPRLLHSVMVRACDLIDAQSAEIALFRESTNTMEIVACHNMGKDYSGAHLPLGEGAIGVSARDRTPLLIDDYSAWEGAVDFLAGEPWRAVMTVPLTYQHRLVGVIAMADQREARVFGESDLELLTMLAHQVAIAIENAHLFEQVQRLATTDELTGLPNRRELFRIGNILRDEAIEFEQTLTAVMFDIDLFKEINDTYGHSIGDQVLQGLAALCLDRIREKDLLARYGGEEFTLILPDTPYDTACVIAERLRVAAENHPIRTDKGSVHFTVSFGVAPLTSEETNLATLLDQADAAMYRAKNMGRNRVVGADELIEHNPAE